VNDQDEIGHGRELIEASWLRLGFNNQCKRTHRKSTAKLSQGQCVEVPAKNPVKRRVPAVLALAFPVSVDRDGRRSEVRYGSYSNPEHQGQPELGSASHPWRTTSPRLRRLYATRLAISEKAQTSGRCGKSEALAVVSEQPGEGPGAAEISDVSQIAFLARFKCGPDR
jgi:hypothetical protein